MNDALLHIYLNDHLALIVGELALARRSAGSNRETSLGVFLCRLENEIEIQRDVLSDVLRRTGGSESWMKQGAAWFAEKLGRFKLNGSLLSYSELSRVVELEALTATAQERVALWDTLDAVSRGDQRLTDIRFRDHHDRAQAHVEELSTQRRDAASWAFA